MAAEPFLRKFHRVVAVLFLLSIPPAGVASATGDPAAPSPLVYVPLFPLLALTITGTYLLVVSWVRWQRTRRSAPAAVDAAPK